MTQRLLCLTVLLAAATYAAAGATAAPRASQPLDTPLQADLDGDGTNETVRIRETHCFSARGETAPPCSKRDDVFRTVVVEVADACVGAGEHVLTLSREMDAVNFARLFDADGDGEARELAFELRAGASGRGVQSKIVSFMPGEGGCVAVRKTLFSYPQPATIGQRPRGTSFSTGGLVVRNFTSRWPGAELRTFESYVRGTDPGCCPSYDRTTYWRYVPSRLAYTPYRTKLRKLR
jgi:hypothetical protein